MHEKLISETSSPSAPVDDHLYPLFEELRRLGGDAAPPEVLDAFAAAFHFRTPRPYLSGKSLGKLAEELLSIFRFADRRPEKEIRVRIRLRDGGEPSLLQTCMEDQPFILDSVQEILRVQEISIHNYLHPILQIDRGADRRITAVRPRTAPGSRESILHFEIGPLKDEESRQALEREVLSTLMDARHAVEDFSAMKHRAAEFIAEIEAYQARDAAEKHDLVEAADLIRWLLNENFVFLGVRSYRFFQKDREDHIQVEPGSGLGILRDESASAFREAIPFAKFPEDLRRRFRLRIFPLVSKTNSLSRVHRRVPMDYIGIKRIGARGEIEGEHRILGLFTAQALNQLGAEIPVLRRKLETILERAQVIRESHEYKQIIGTFNTIPKAELFATSVEEIARNIEEIIALERENEVRVSCRRDLLGRGFSVMAIIPRDRFSSTSRKRIQAALSERFGVPAADYRLALSDEPYARLHFYFPDPTGKLRLPRAAELDALVVDCVRTWDDDFLQELIKLYGGERGGELARRYGPALPESYRAGVSPREAADDARSFEKIQAAGGIEVAIHDAAGPEGKGLIAIRLIRSGEKFFLSHIMPVLTNLGLLVIDETPHAVRGPGVSACHLHAIRAQRRSGESIPPDRLGRLQEAIIAILEGRYESDPFGELVVAAGLAVREVELVRVYAHYFRQIGSPHAISSMAAALAAHPQLTALLVEFFKARFQPGGRHPAAPDRENGPLPDLRARFSSGLDGVADINEDRILRGLWSLVEATVRTNYFQNGGLLPRIALKIESGKVPGMPRPVPLYEIFVRNQEMAGIHLRSGKVARGGIRWSDRRDDFRTEVLGLMRTQVTKNAIIVPVGSKGGFVIRKTPDAREDLAAEVERQYRTFISGLLDLTDNLVNGKVVHPDYTMVYDGPDPYLVVAADRGTATFSDLANRIAREYRFWLDDAFASGGSNGYDHKKHGITARGAWECIRHHFRELGLDIDREPFTVVGIGDMSGDVFGNGMLLSRQIRLAAAFDHRHIFVDPDPDPEASFQERERLFRLPRSSWMDYRGEAISAGGGVFQRTAKKIGLSPEMRRLLGVEAESLSGEELIRSILKLPVDLLYNGGIGTYVKASHESHADVHDEKNDAVRIDAAELRCRAAGEGGNLGFTQAARVEFARGGGRIHTDFIDNSGGVDLSDHEVNIKIAFGNLVHRGAMGLEERNRLLESIAPEVCDLVLATNRGQAFVLSLEELSSRSDFYGHLDLLKDLQRAGILDPRLDRFPDQAELARRAEAGLGLLRPELATLLAFSKIEISRALQASDLIDSPGFEEYLPSYFPRAVVERCGERLRDHPLRREIAITRFTNEMVHHCGMTYIARLRSDLGIGIPDAARAFRVADQLLEGTEFFREIEEPMQTGALKAQAGFRLAISYRETVFDIACWLLRSWPLGPDRAPLSVRAVIERLQPWFQKAAEWLEDAAPGAARDRIAEREGELAAAGAPAPLAARAGLFRLEGEIPPLVHIAEKSGMDPARIAHLFFAVRETLRMGEVLGALEKLPVQGPADRSAAGALKEELRTLAVRLTARVIASGAGPAEPGDPAAIVQSFFDASRPGLDAYLEVIDSAASGRGWTLSSLIVLSERLRRLTDPARPDRA